MKKLFCILSAFILTISAAGCSGGDAVRETEISDTAASSQTLSISETASSSQTTTFSEDTYEASAVSEQEGSIFKMELEYGTEHQLEYLEDRRKMLSLILESAVTGEAPVLVTEYYEMELPALAGVKLDSYEVTDESFDKSSWRYEVTVRLCVSESESEFIPKGTGEYVFICISDEFSLFLPLRRKGELDENALLPFGDNISERAKFCNDFTAYFSDFFSGNEVTDFSSPDLSVCDNDSYETIFNALLTAGRYYHIDDYEYPYEVFDTALKELYGFSADSLGTKETGYYNAETDTVSIPGRGSYWFDGYLSEESCDEETGLYTITIDYFADGLFLDRAATFRYTVRENENGSYTMLKMERLFSTDKHIIGGCV